ncbi:hypothetical protein ACFQX6_37280 [Streptosporangium lutulentum]
MLAVLAWNNVRRQKTAFAAAFAAVSLAVALVGGSGLLLVSADTVREAGHPDMDTVVSLLALMAVLSGLVSIFVVAGTLSFHVMQQRRRVGAAADRRHDTRPGAPGGHRGGDGRRRHGDGGG